jgi:hypothetical protein
MEFSVDPLKTPNRPPIFALLQMRSMTSKAQLTQVSISTPEIQRAFCCSTRALGNLQRSDIFDLVYIDPQTFNPAQTRQIVPEIAYFNQRLNALNRPYLLIGPGRWGSSDPWLGIPVGWSDISGVAGIVESGLPALKAEPSQGSHFFHNVATIGIAYLSITGAQDFLRWDRLAALPAAEKKKFTIHVQLPRPCTLKVDGRTSLAVIMENE